MSELASFEEAIAMASSHPRAALAPALEAMGLAPETGEVEWDADLRVRRVRLGGIERDFPAGMRLSSSNAA